MKITVLGAGSMGAPVVRELCLRSDDVEQVQVCDTRSQALQRLHREVGDDRHLRSFQVDARDMSVLSQIIQGSDCVISCVPSEFNPDLAKLCLDLGVHFCDLGGNDALVAQELALDEQARGKSIWIVPNCGLAPGLINVLCMHGIDRLDRTEAAHLRVGDVPLHPEPPFNFRISWSAERILEDYTNPAQLIENSQVVEVESLSREEEIYFEEEPFGTMEAFCTRGGLSTLTETLAGDVEALDHKTIRWPGHAQQMRFLIGLGLADDRKIGVQTHLTYRDVLVRQMRKRLGGDYEDAVLMRVLLRGEQDGRPATLVYEMVERYDETTQQTAMKRCTAIPTVVAALFLAREEAVSSGGADVAENVLPRNRFLEKVAERGLNIRKERHDGFREVTAKKPLDSQHA